uniref:Arf-GAP domain-containing protein n=1 Tax=Rhodosorus marinus TaxID=101924 RepID=A0A7S3A5H2_9RHOD|mmetsp:Transcript_44232/g.172246  ORF Transcript_44232/g.172246 Transcript_44232/m.172246 type:complete len:293 (+) Transcript_44232:222-1100(+)|eukprot:CAMPEP_0113957832 /NCGR_PEP_ID=MMETSP0011_2-20120614/3000_1 /TAXON_ID=101924 /ORGANISM="Rhodosorus marinus" /LENGTH=292 /DNA_ID=CAMNT_0000968461 /DNA_START=187 /DNA_END=1065 /DNA_ORIENTATION=- /assembly_acc=CAM_ASM_000156
MAGRGGEEAFRIIDEELRDPANNHCAECGGESTHANLTLGIFVCSVCAGIHADMNRRIRSLGQDYISVEDAMRLVDIGNARSRMKWMAKYNPRDYDEPEPSTSKDAIKEFIWLKYEGNWEGDPATYDMRYDRFPSIRPPPLSASMHRMSSDFRRPPKTGSRTKKKSSKKKKRSKSHSSSESEGDGVVIMTHQGPVSVSPSAAVVGQVAQAQQAQQMHQMRQMQQAQVQMQQMQQMQQLQQWQAQQAYATMNPNATSTNPMGLPGQYGQPLNRSSSSQGGYENKDPTNPFDHL